MPVITYKNRKYISKASETVLETLLRNGADVAFSCKQGICQTCLLKCTDGELTTESQSGLDQGLQRKNYMMPCVCKVSGDLTLTEPEPRDLTGIALVHEKTMISPDVCKLLLEPSLSIYYHAGQYINLRMESGLSRSYSIASVPHRDYFLELHIKRHPRGRMSNWLVDDLAVGDELEFTRPAGKNYFHDDIQGNILLLGTGTGLAPLLGIARDALYSKYTGNICLYHGGRIQSDLYYHQELLALANEFTNFHYRPCLSRQGVSVGISSGHIDEIVMNDYHRDFAGFTIHLAGNPDVVTQLQQKFLATGVDKTSIFSDPFITAKPEIIMEPPENSDAEQSNIHNEEQDYPPPAPEIWNALENGELLGKILDDFYDAVYEDPQLSPFFKNSTKQRAKEKVYSFYRRVFTGDKVYFGDRPRNAHHWMVITDELLDYREDLLESFLRKHGLSEKLIQLWRNVDEHYRKDLVKTKPQGRWIGDRETPASGFDRIKLDVGSICDVCHSEIDSGTEVIYHLRTGEVSCPACCDVTQEPSSCPV